MDIRGAVQLAAVLIACAVSVCECGGTLKNPVTDGWLCNHMVPPGMEGKDPVREFHLYFTAINWFAHFAISIVTAMSDYTFIGVILQGRVDNKPCGVFKEYIKEGVLLDCPPYMQNVFYSINLTSPRFRTFAYWIPPPGYESKNLTMLTTVIKNSETYYTYVDIIKSRPNTVQSTTLSTSTTLAAKQTTSMTPQQDTNRQHSRRR